MHQVVLSRRAEKDLRKIDKKDKPHILTSFVQLRKDPFAGKKLRGKYKDCYSLRIWPYRIIYKVYKKKSVVLIVRVGHRGGVY